MATMSVMRFDRDEWHEVAAKELVETDLIYYQGKLIEVTGQPTVVDGKVHLSARPYQAEDNPIVVAVGEEWRERQATTAVMDYTNSACCDFGDGTHMIAVLEEGPGAIYSPRLPTQQLEKWCMDNLDRFEAFFEANEVALDRGEIVKMEPWWAS